jgi:hypothetical protein
MPDPDEHALAAPLMPAAKWRSPRCRSRPRRPTTSSSPCGTARAGARFGPGRRGLPRLCRQKPARDLPLGSAELRGHPGGGAGDALPAPQRALKPLLSFAAGPRQRDRFTVAYKNRNAEFAKLASSAIARHRRRRPRPRAKSSCASRQPRPPPPSRHRWLRLPRHFMQVLSLGGGPLGLGPKHDENHS